MWQLILPRKTGQPQTMEYGGGGEFISFIESPELYNIVDDPYERRNVASEYPNVVEDLIGMIEDWWEPEF